MEGKVVLRELFVNASISIENKKMDDYSLVSMSKYFDASWYLQRYYIDVICTGMTPLDHFMSVGWQEGKEPSRYFSCKVYLDNYPDVREGKINPLLHYEKFGRVENRFNVYEILLKNGFVDEKWYKANYRYDDKLYISSLEHYLVVGWKLGYRNKRESVPNLFYTINPDVNRTTYAPIINYIENYNCLFYDYDHIVAHFWGVFSTNDGNYIIFSSRGRDLRLKFRNHEIRGVQLADNAFIIFEKYIHSEFGEYATAYKFSENNLKRNEKINIFQKDDDASVEIKILFSWNLISCKRLLGNNLFFAVRGNKLIVKDRRFFEKTIKKNNVPLEIRTLEYFKERSDTKSIILFSEFRSVTNDNAWEIFLKRVERNEDTYFVTSKSKYNKLENEKIRRHVVVYNSERHIELYMRANKLVCSWTLSDIVPSFIKHNPDFYPFINKKWFYCPHGISYDKNSNFLTPIFLGYPEIIFCCSGLERNYFEKICGQKHVAVSGYPRMDKWTDIREDAILFSFTYRKHYTPTYSETIIKTVKRIRLRFPQRKIYYIFHPALSKKIRNEIVTGIDDASIQYADADDETKFNEMFAKSKYLITDYSSVAYDFSYKNGSVAIYYLPSGFTSGHYDLLESFWDNTMGVLTYTQDELELALELERLPDLNEERRKAFFEYLDRGNTTRVLDMIEEKL